MSDAESLVRRDKYGFEKDNRFLDLELSLAEKQSKIAEQTRNAWNKFLATHPLDNLEKSKPLKKLVRSGIPPEYRAQVWLKCTGVSDVMNYNQGVYRQLVKESSHVDNQATRQIERDLRRTFPGHPKYDTPEGIDTMRRVLVAYSERNPDIGYCQSMNYVVALLLIVLDEEEAFWLLVHLIEKVLPAEFYSPTMLGAHVEQHVLDALVHSKCPKLAKHLDGLDIAIPLITAQWFLTLFVTVLPTEATLRVWDCFFYEGMKVLYRSGVSLFRVGEKQLLQCEDMGSAFKHLQDLPASIVDPELLMDGAFKRRKVGSFPMAAIVASRDYFRPRVAEELKGLRRAREDRVRERQEALDAMKTAEKNNPYSPEDEED